MNVGSVDAAGWNDSQSAAQTTAEVGENVTREVISLFYGLRIWFESIFHLSKPPENPGGFFLFPYDNTVPYHSFPSDHSRRRAGLKE